MSDNPQYGATTDFALPEIRVLALTGSDAVGFAQSQFMNDVGSLGDGQWQWSGWLDPKGRVQAFFTLLRLDPQALWLVTAQDPEPMRAALSRFVFRSKVRLDVLPLHGHGRLAAPANARGSTSTGNATDGIELDFSGSAGGRTLMLTGTPGDLDGKNSDAWWTQHLVQGCPSLPGTALDNWTPQQLSLQRLNAFSVRKGCYPGQEIVARTHFLGRAKRGLARIVTEAAASDEVEITDDKGRAIGQIVCRRGRDALAVVPLEPADLPLHLAGSVVARAELASGLER